MTTNSAAANAGLITNSTTTTPARKLFDKIEFKDMDTKKKGYLEQIVVELEKAQLLDFSLKYRYIKVGIILREAKKELSLKGDDWKEFYTPLGLQARAEERYRQIASNKWFTKLTEEDAPKLHHLTQADMITMSKVKDEDEFNSMLNGNHDFSTPKATDEEIAEVLETAYNEAKFSKITLEQYKTFSKNSVSALIKIIDKTLSQIDEPNTVSAQLPKQVHSSDKKSQEA